MKKQSDLITYPTINLGFRTKKGWKHTEETKQKMRKSNPFTNKKRPKEIGIKISLAKKGKSLSEFHKKQLSIAHLGKKLLENHKKNISASLKKFYHIHRKKYSLEKVKNKIYKRCSKYKKWRTAVFERDNYTCIWCGQRGGELNADHIVPFSIIFSKLIVEQGLENLYEKCLEYELFWDIDNGRTLCLNCHKKTETYGVCCGKKK